MSPTLSIIVPVYKTELYLAECLDSILSLEYKDWELILVDDGSPDSCPDICDRYAASDPRVKVIHQANGGVSTARNAAMDIARGRYWTFIDSDDCIASDSYGNAVAILDERDDIDFVQYPICERWQTTGTSERRTSSPVIVVGGSEIYRSYLRYGVITGYMTNKVWRANLFDHLRFPVGMCFEDRYLQVDVFLDSRAAYVTPVGKYFYRGREGSATRGVRSVFFWRSIIKADKHRIEGMKRVGGLGPQLFMTTLRLFSYRLRLGVSLLLSKQSS